MGYIGHRFFIVLVRNRENFVQSRFHHDFGKVVIAHKTLLQNCSLHLHTASTGHGEGTQRNGAMLAIHDIHIARDDVIAVHVHDQVHHQPLDHGISQKLENLNNHGNDGIRPDNCSRAFPARTR